LKNISIIHQMKTNIIAQNGNINFGASVQNSHTSNLKVVGAAFSFGDHSCANEAQKQLEVIERTEEEEEISSEI
jgi:Spore germination protein gerPA/gerPF